MQRDRSRDAGAILTVVRGLATACGAPGRRPLAKKAYHVMVQFIGSLEHIERTATNASLKTKEKIFLAHYKSVALPTELNRHFTELPPNFRDGRLDRAPILD